MSPALLPALAGAGPAPWPLAEPALFMNASAVDPLHVAEQRVPPIRCCGKPACGVRGMQAGGLAAQSVTVLQGVRLPPSRLHAGDPLLLLVQWVERNEPS